MGHYRFGQFYNVVMYLNKVTQLDSPFCRAFCFSLYLRSFKFALSTLCASTIFPCVSTRAVW